MLGDENPWIYCKIQATTHREGTTAEVDQLQFPLTVKKRVL